MLNFPSSTSDNSSTKIIGKKFHDQTSQILPITEDYQQIITENLLKNGTNNHSNEKYYSSERRNQIYGQKINLHHTNTATNSDKIQSRGVTRTLTPPPQRITSKSKPNNIKVEENPHRIHHKPGSTVPNLKAGSERTNRAAKWLVDEQYKNQQAKRDLESRLLLARDIDKERRDRAKAELYARDQADMKRVLAGKDPFQPFKEVPHFSSIGKKQIYGAETAPVYHSVDCETGSGTFSNSKSITSLRQPVPRLSHINIHSLSHPQAPSETDDANVEPKQNSALLKLLHGAQNAELPSPGIQIRLRPPVEDVNTGLDEFEFTINQVGQAPNEEDAYGGDSDFEADEVKDGEVERKPSPEELETDEHSPRTKSETHNKVKEIRKEQARKYLEEKKKKFNSDLKAEREKQKKLEEEKKSKLQALDAKRKTALRESKKLSVPPSSRNVISQNDDSGGSATPPPPPQAEPRVQRYSSSVLEENNFNPALNARMSWALDVARIGDDSLHPSYRHASIPPPPPPYHAAILSPDEVQENPIVPRSKSSDRTRPSKNFIAGSVRKSNEGSTRRSNSPATTRQSSSPPRNSREKLKPEVPKQTRKRRSTSPGLMKQNYESDRKQSHSAPSRKESEPRKVTEPAYPISTTSYHANINAIDLLSLEHLTPERPKKQLHALAKKIIHPQRVNDEPTNSSGSLSKTTEDKSAAIPIGQVSSLAKGNEDAALRLLRSMDRLREEVANYSENVNKIVTLSTRESHDEILLVRTSIQNRLSAAIESIEFGAPDHHSEQKSTDDLIDKDNQHDDQSESSSMVDEDDEDPWNTQLHPPIKENLRSRDKDVTPSESQDMSASESITSGSNYYPKPHEEPPLLYYEPGAVMDSGDILLNHQMGLLRDKNEMLKRIRADSPDFDSQNFRSKSRTRESSQEELVWGDSSYRIERIGGQDRLIKSSIADERTRSQHETMNPMDSSYHPSLRNVGNLAGVLNVKSLGNATDREISDYSDSDSTTDPINSSSDHRIISILANEIYQQIQSENQIRVESERAKQLITESIKLYSPAHDQEVSLDQEKVNEDLLTPRTYWDMMMARSTITGSKSLSPLAHFETLSQTPTVEVLEIPASDNEPSPVPPPPSQDSLEPTQHLSSSRRIETIDESKRTTSGAELQLRMFEELYKQEQLFNLALDLSEAEQAHTVQTATHRMNEMMKHAQSEVLQIKYQNDMIQMQHAYEMALAATAAEAVLSTQLEIARRDVAYTQLALEAQRQQDEHNQITYLSHAIQNVNHAGELLQLQQSVTHSQIENQTPIVPNKKSDLPTSPPKDPSRHGISKTDTPLPDLSLVEEEDNLNDSTTYSVSFEQESTIQTKPSRKPTSQSYDYISEDESSKEKLDISEVPDESFHHSHSVVKNSTFQDSADDYELTFVEESIASPNRLQHISLSQSNVIAEDSIRSRLEDRHTNSILEESISMDPDLQNNADKSHQSGESLEEYSEDYVEDHETGEDSSMKQSRSKRISFLDSQPSSAPTDQETAELIAELLRDLDTRQKSLEKSITLRLQIEKKKMESQLQELASKFSNKPKKNEYMEEKAHIENEYQAIRAELEKERWTLNAQIYQEKRKYEQLRRDLAKQQGSTVSKNQQVNIDQPKKKPAPPVVTVGNRPLDNSYDSAPESIVNESSYSVSYSNKFSNKESDNSVYSEDYADVSEEEEIVEDLESKVDSRIKHPEESESFSDGEMYDSQAEDEYGSEIFENVSAVDISISTTKPPKPTRVSQTEQAPSRESKSSFRLPNIEADPTVPTKEELERRNQELIRKRQQAAELVKLRNEELERKKELIRIEEEERELERVFAEAMKYDLERELEEHRRLARIEAKKAAEAAAAELKRNKKPEKPSPSTVQPAPKPVVSKPLNKSNVPPKKVLDDSIEDYYEDSFVEVSRQNNDSIQEVEDSYSDDEVSVEDEVSFERVDSHEIKKIKSRDEAIHEALQQSVNSEIEEQEEDHSIAESAVNEEFEAYSESEKIEEDVLSESQESEPEHKPASALGVSVSQYGISYADDFEDEKSLAFSKSKVASTDYLSDFEDTEKEMSQTDGGSSQGIRSNSSDTFAEIEKSLEQRNQRIEVLKDKLSKMQTEKKLERLRAKQSERERLEKEEFDLLQRIKNEEEMYLREKQRILQRGTVERDNDEPQDEEDLATEEFIAILKEPLETQEEVLKEEDLLAGDSWGSQQEQHFNIPELTMKTTITRKIREIEASRTIQTLIRGFLARKHFAILREKESLAKQERQQYEVQGDLIEEYEKTKGYEQLYADDSFGSDEVASDFDTESEDSTRLAELENVVQTLGALSEVRNQMATAVDPPLSQSKLEVVDSGSAEDDFDKLGLGIQTNSMIFDEENQRWISTSKSGEVDMSGFDDSSVDEIIPSLDPEVPPAISTEPEVPSEKVLPTVDQEDDKAIEVATLDSESGYQDETFESSISQLNNQDPVKNIPDVNNISIPDQSFESDLEDIQEGIVVAVHSNRDDSGSIHFDETKPLSLDIATLDQNDVSDVPSEISESPDSGLDSDQDLFEGSLDHNKAMAHEDDLKGQQEKREPDDWFEESLEEVAEAEVDRTIDSIGVDVLQEVRSPTKSENNLPRDVDAKLPQEDMMEVANKVTDHLVQSLIASLATNPEILKLLPMNRQAAESDVVKEKPVIPVQEEKEMKLTPLDIEEEEDYADDSFVEENSADEPISETTTLQPTPSAGISSLRDLPSLGVKPSAQVSSAPPKRDEVLDALLGDEEDDPRSLPSASVSRFGLPKSPREDDSFVQPVPDPPQMIWKNRQTKFLNEILQEKPVIDELLVHLNDPNYQGKMISEEILGESEVNDPINSSDSLYKRILLDRINEILGKLHHTRHLSNDCSHTIPLSQKLLAKNLPLERKTIASYLEQKLQTTKDMNTTTDTIQIHALENIRDVLQSGMMETAENITNLILSRLIIDITHTLIQHMVR